MSYPTARGVRIRVELPGRINHLPGQHYVIRLTAEDGYTAQRSYSVASAPSDPLLEFFIDRLPDGEVSGFLADIVEVGDELELRGPIGGWFVWNGTAPALGIGGGSGVVPLVSMLRHAAGTAAADLLRVAVSARSLDELPYADELAAAGAVIALSRTQSPTGRPAGRLAAAEIASLVRPDQTCLVCGSAGFAEAVTGLLLDAGTPTTAIRVERFGPSG
ncbi:FAD-binding oxidoreductase [Jatrophihabitans sp.]|uniref:FAD-binding oxidoreductase n=1 Tax=Jatrophihabitans sp. TaxID=1932789 RepID=UPI0030C6E72A